MNISKEDGLLLLFTKQYIAEKPLEPGNDSLRDINWENFLKKAERHKIFPFIYNVIIPFVPLKQQTLFDHRYYDFITKCNIYLRELGIIFRLAMEHNIRMVLLKGFSLSKLVYDDLYKRPFGDLDLLVDEENLEKIYYLLNETGYEQYAGYDEESKKHITVNTVNFKYQLDYHEFPCLKTIDGFNILVELKRYSSAIPLKYIVDFLNNTRTINIAGMDICTTDITYSFLHLCSNVYHDLESVYGALVGTQLGDFLDIAIFLRKYGQSLNWNTVYELSIKYEIAHKIYYLLNRVAEIFDYKAVGQDIIDRFSPVHISSYSYDGNSDGSFFNWKSDFIERMFNDVVRIIESRRLYIRKMYEKKHAGNFEEVFNDTTEIIFNFNRYREFYIEKSKTTIKHVFTHDDKNLFFYSLLDKEVMCDEYFFDVIFIINSSLPLSESSIVRVDLKNDVNVKTFDLTNYSWEHLSISGKIFLKIILSLGELKLGPSNDVLIYNMSFGETFSGDVKTIYEYKYDDAVFLRIVT
ncbi:MAG: nucleotidyltransferase family protein [Bacteroidales bacterium]|jgi:hypothetical protein|nr:nucleotidyltransferase family protein [Bacteroidales bacterium]